MTKDEIIENNKLIAKFMGAKKTTNCNNNELWIPKQSVCKINTIDLGRGQIICYHKSWDWLMPVVDKIRDIKNECKLSNKDVYNRKDRGFGLYGNKFLVNTNFNYTYSGVIEFIKWYSENK